ncbi:hypothetical protein ETB97_004455 [Aspergillus alliaceus]|uniref:Glutamine repeat protein-1 n=1 Tax=Petromyces alliaceus TaxID=209559 RepID=A0A5N7CHC5_PETAA|nr:hypothetical protein BDV23DRAFT_149388 [Aspergillus alliaceus]KAF5858377.1 hypothetical protein ETB97_004455 [Aspergillus burnettii]
MDPNTTGFPMLQQQQQHAGYPVTSQSPQQFSYYPNAIPSFPQQKAPSHIPQQQHSFGAMPMQAGAPGGAMMPSGFPQHSAPPHANFSAPFAQPPIPVTMSQFMPPQAVTTSTPPSTVATTIAPSFPQNMASISANNMVSAQPQRPPPQQTLQPQPTPTAPATPSPATAREKARVTVLLDINSMLLQEVVNLQAAGKAGGPPPQPQDSNPSSDQAPEPAKGPTQKPSQEYIDCMRRLQANLAYLATIADRAKKSGGVPPSAPGIMTPPPHMPSMNEMYKKLAELFPRTAPGAAGTPQPSPQGIQGNGRPSPSPATETVV